MVERRVAAVVMETVMEKRGIKVGVVEVAEGTRVMARVGEIEEVMVKVLAEGALVVVWVRAKAGVKEATAVGVLVMAGAVEMEMVVAVVVGVTVVGVV